MTFHRDPLSAELSGVTNDTIGGTNPTFWTVLRLPTRHHGEHLRARQDRLHWLRIHLMAASDPTVEQRGRPLYEEK
jgi:hypothetical protein